MSNESQRRELHSTIWKIADDLRGSVDGWDFKQYVLGMLFYRFISENLTSYINSQEHNAGNIGFDYAQISDAEAEDARGFVVSTKGFFILPSELWFLPILTRQSFAPNGTNLPIWLIGLAILSA